MRYYNEINNLLFASNLSCAISPCEIMVINSILIQIGFYDLMEPFHILRNYYYYISAI